MTSAERVRAWRAAHPEQSKAHNLKLNARRKRERLELKELRAQVQFLQERLDMAELALARANGRLSGTFGPRRVVA